MAIGLTPRISINLLLMCSFYLLAGLNHFRDPSFYLPLIPDYIPFPNTVNAMSGAVEILVALGLLSRKTIRLSGNVIITLLILFIPSHIHFIAIGACVEGGLCVSLWVAWVRLIIVHPALIYWAWRSTQYSYLVDEMKEKLRYVLGALVTIPFLPLLAWQGKRVKSSVPVLPEAQGPVGVVGSKEKDKLSIIAIGESTLAGVGVSTHEEGFTGTLAAELSRKMNKEVRWRVYARSGYTAERLRRKILPKIEETNVDLIVVGTGGNDAFQLNNPWRWTRDIKALIKGIQGRFGDTPIVFLNMPPIKEFPAFTSLIHFVLGNLVEILGDTLSKIVSLESNVFYYAKKITLQEWIKEMNLNVERAAFFSDGVHPSKLTYQTWAKDLANFVTSKSIV